MNRLLALLKKEFIQMRRDRLTLVILLIMPVVQLIIYGFAINTDVKHLKTAVFDQSLSAESRELLNSFTASEYFDLIYIEDSFEDVNRRVDAGDAKVGVIIPPDLEESGFGYSGGAVHRQCKIAGGFAGKIRSAQQPDFAV